MDVVTTLPDYALQSLDWQARTLTWLVERVPNDEREAAAEMVMAAFRQAEIDGFDEATRLAEDIAKGAPTNRGVQVVARALLDLRARNYGAKP